MSLILDALRRADAERQAERQRGQTPSLQQVAQAAAPPASPRPPGGLRTVLAGVAGVVLLAAAAWWWLRPAATPAPAPAARASSNVGSETPADVSPPPVAVPVPAAVPPALTATPPPRSPVVSLAPPSPPPRPAAPPKAEPERPVPLSSLPPDQRAALVRLGLSGGVYSPDRAQRFVLVGGQLVREGASLGGDVVLDRIEPRSAVLRVGTRLVEVPL